MIFGASFVWEKLSTCEPLNVELDVKTYHVLSHDDIVCARQPASLIQGGQIPNAVPLPLSSRIGSSLGMARKRMARVDHVFVVQQADADAQQHLRPALGGGRSAGRLATSTHALFYRPLSPHACPVGVYFQTFSTNSGTSFVPRTPGPICFDRRRNRIGLKVNKVGSTKRATGPDRSPRLQCRFRT